MQGNLEARRLVDKRTIELARLRWTLEDQARRLERSRRWLEASAAVDPAPDPHPSGEASEPTARGTGRRKVQIRVTESREVNITLEDESADADPDVIEHPRRPAP